MKKVIMYKYFNPDNLFGGYGWSIDKIWDDWNHVYSDAYEVEIPDNFSIGETITGEKMYFKDGCDLGYQLNIGNINFKNGNPYLIGGSPTESVKCNVIKKIDLVPALSH